MFSLKSIILLSACLVLSASAAALEYQELYEPHQPIIDYQPVLKRYVRSPEGGSVDLTYKQDQAGREASVQYNHNLYSSGSASVDAYAQASRNFDRNQNDYSGGIRGSWRF